MDEIITTVTRDCVVAWKCPKCARYVARQSMLRGGASIPMGGRFSKNMKMDELRDLMAMQIDKHVFRMKVSSDEPQNQEVLAAMSLGMDAYQLVTCPYCECQPAWSEESNGEIVGGCGMLLMPLWNLLGAVLGMIIGGMICMFLNLDGDLFGWVLVPFAIAGVGGAVYLFSGAWKNRRAVQPTEKHHQPLAAFRKEIDIDETDPRSAALAAYIEEHPLVSFGAKVNSGIHVHADID